MPGILPPGIANSLTSFFGNRIDFSKFGRTSTEKGILSYNTRQLIDRGIIWGGIFVGGAVGDFLRRAVKDKSKNSSSASIALWIAAGVMGGFLTTHWYISKNQINNRQRLINDIDKLEEEARELAASIVKCLDECPYDLLTNIQLNITAIKQISCSTDERSNATQTLITRKTCMKRLVTQLKNDNQQAEERTLDVNAYSEFWQENQLEFFRNSNFHAGSASTVKMS